MIHDCLTGPLKGILKRAFAPGDWLTKAQNVLGLSRNHVHKLASGRANITLHHRRAIATYCNQRLRARKQVVAREIVKLERLYQAAEQDWATAETALRAKEIELIRQGRK